MQKILYKNIYNKNCVGYLYSETENTSFYYIITNNNEKEIVYEDDIVAFL